MSLGIRAKGSLGNNWVVKKKNPIISLSSELTTHYTKKLQVRLRHYTNWSGRWGAELTTGNTIGMLARIIIPIKFGSQAFDWSVKPFDRWLSINGKKCKHEEASYIFNKISCD